MTPFPDKYLREVVTAAPEASARDAARQMKDTGVGALVVLDGDEVVGVVTDRDLALGALREGVDPEVVSVRDLMSSPAVTVPVDEGLVEATHLMRRHLVRRLPIVDGEGRLAGLITADDLTAGFGDQLAWAGQATRAGFDYEAAAPEALGFALGRE